MPCSALHCTALGSVRHRIVLAMRTLMMWFVNAVLHYTALLHGDRLALAMRIPLMQFANAALHCTARSCGDHAARDIKNIGIIVTN